MREKQFENQVKAFLQSVGIYRLGTSPDEMPMPPQGYYLKRWGGSKFIPAGVPDMQITIGVFNIDVELKSETGRLDDLQVQKLVQIMDAGGYAIVLRPKDFEAFQTFISWLIIRNQQLKDTGEIWLWDIGKEEINEHARKLFPNRHV